MTRPSGKPGPIHPSDEGVVPAILWPMSERVTLEIGTITLDWSDWAPWIAVLTDA